MPATAMKTKFKEATNRWRQFNWNVHLLIGMIGLVVIGSVGFGFYRSNQLYQKYFPLIDASMEMRLEATTAYLWFEEMIGGDKSKNMDDILTHLDRADWYSKAMIEGGESEHLKLLPDKDSPFRDRILNLQVQLASQRALMNQRIEAASNSGPGSRIDSLYHETLEDFVQNANHLEMDIKRIMIKDYQAFRNISLGVIAVCLFLFVIAGYAYYRYERLRQRSYSESLQLEKLLGRNEKMAALGAMISGLAHEMNNPNNFISFNTPILKDYIRQLLPVIDIHAKENPNFEVCDMPYQEFRKDLLKLLNTIENGSNRINRIVSDLKVFSRKKDQVKKEKVNLKKVIEKTVAVTKVDLSASVESIETQVSNGAMEAHGDEEVLQIILTNLLLNAADAADKSNAWIRLSARTDAKAPNFIKISIEDNGCGITDNHIHRIFDPFYSTRSNSGKGGMGLYLCRTLADQMGANIEVDSQAGIGSTFTLNVSKYPGHDDSHMD